MTVAGFCVKSGNLMKGRIRAFQRSARIHGRKMARRCPGSPVQISSFRRDDSSFHRTISRRTLPGPIRTPPRGMIANEPLSLSKACQKCASVSGKGRGKVLGPGFSAIGIAVLDSPNLLEFFKESHRFRDKSPGPSFAKFSSVLAQLNHGPPVFGNRYHGALFHGHSPQTIRKV